MTTIDTPRLEVHVLGAGKGESIIIRLPDGKWGVVDCCAGSSTDPDQNATLGFLRRRGVAELEFLALTHPHDDHFRGMSHLLESFPVRCFWRFNGLSGPHFLRLVRYLRIEAESIDRIDEIDAGREFERIFALIASGRRRGQASPLQKRSGPATLLYPVPPDEGASLRIVGLAPSGNQVDRYERGLLRCFNEDGTMGSRLPRAHHNLISMALLIVFGKTRILLGGDVERDGWRDAIAEMGTDALASHGVKISHHGSTSGYCEGLWSHISAGTGPIAVVTAYAAQRLPRKAALDHIRPHTRDLYATCLTAVQDDQLPSWADPGSARLRLALRAKMGEIARGTSHECGCCTLIFDDCGNCLSVEAAPPAGRLTDGPRR